jgi:urease accessory protein
MKHCIRLSSIIQKIACVFAIVLAPSLALAHVGVGQTGGVIHGLAHPITGFDHIAAMVAVGLWAAQRSDRSVWAVPLSFVMAMSVGSAIGVADVSIPFVEPGIGASVLVLGLLIAAAVRMPLIASSFLVGLFAVFHGHAHGAEMPETVSGLTYGIGFVLSTCFLHGCGIGLGLLVQRFACAHLVRYAGGVTAVFGIYLLIA